MYSYADVDGKTKVLLTNLELDPEYYLKKIDEMRDTLNDKVERRYTIVVTEATAKIHFELIEVLRNHYDVQVVGELPKVVVIDSLGQLNPYPEMEYIDEVPQHKINLHMRCIAGHKLEGRRGKGDRIRRRQQFKNQCGYRGRTK